MYIEERLRGGRRRRVWVGRRPAFVIVRGGRSLLVVRPRLARLAKLRVGCVVALNPVAGVALAIKRMGARRR